MKDCRVKSRKVDFIGNAILDYLRKNSGHMIGFGDCAEYCGVHYTTVQKRMTKFRAEGIVKVVGNKRYEVVES